jgi:DNA polymerase III epsilon subunit-like protein
MLAREATITVIDFEGTGSLPGYPNQPWQVGLVTLRCGKVDTDSIFGSLLHVGDRPFSRHAPGRHAELRDSIRSAPYLTDMWPRLRPYLEGVPAAGHNIATEKRFISDAFPLHIPSVWVDTLKLSRMAYPSLPSHKLEDVVRHCRQDDRVRALVPGATYHDAVYDAVATAAVLEHLMAQPGWQDLSLAALAAAQPSRYRSARPASPPPANGTV